jgi:hypothetical protein
MGRIEEIARELEHDQRQGFDPPYTTINVGLVEGGTAKNIIAGECHFTLEWRTIPGQESDHTLNLVRQAAANLQKQESDFVCEIDAARADESFETRADSEVVEFLEKSSGKEAGTVAFGTEAPSLIALGAEAVVFGPATSASPTAPANSSRWINSIAASKFSRKPSNISASRWSADVLSASFPEASSGNHTPTSGVEVTQLSFSFQARHENHESSRPSPHRFALSGQVGSDERRRAGALLRPL